jgi:hypothetical protein
MTAASSYTELKGSMPLSAGDSVRSGAGCQSNRHNRTWWCYHIARTDGVQQASIQAEDALLHGPIQEVACAVVKQGASFKAPQIPSWKPSWSRAAGMKADVPALTIMRRNEKNASVSGQISRAAERIMA